MKAKDVFEHLILFQVYLPKYQLDKITEEVNDRINKKESVMTIFYDLETRQELKKYSNPKTGAFTVDFLRDKTKKSVQQLDTVTGALIEEFDSIYDAAIEVGGNKEAAGNISNAAKGKVKTAYGFKWEFC